MTQTTTHEHRDVIIIGAGISGLGAACHLQRECPQKSYLILESRTAIGGTWDLFRYPGIRSDSDLYTYGYDFKPWYGPSIATAAEILRYLHEVVDENALEPHIRFGHRVLSAAWSTQDALWTVEAKTSDGETRRFTGRFLFMCQGYYNYQAGYRPKFPGEENFKGLIIHPQQWPADLDYTGKQMVVIGSGATAATIVPAVADRVAHVTQLQRSPSYYSVNKYEEEDLIKQLRALDLPAEWIHEIKRRKALAESRIFTERALNEPDVVRQELLETTAALLPKGYDTATHFTPRYNPWKERLCLLPEGDFLKAVAAGKASVVTDHIDCLVEDGILLKSGQRLKADIIVSATGIELCATGNIQFSINERPVQIADTWTYKGIMFADMPNLAWTFGYIRSSWTLRSDLIAHYVCRLLNYMEEAGVRQCTPRLRPDDREMAAKPFIDPADFAPGYMRRGVGRLPKQGDREPWVNRQNYYVEKDLLPQSSFDDGVLQFDNAKSKHSPSPHLIDAVGPAIILITGNMASGKSSVAQALAERLTKSVHLRGDLFRRMIVRGQAEMSFELSLEAQQQLKTRYALAVTTAKTYADAGFTVVYQDIILGSALDEVVAAFHPYRLAVVVLCPRAAVMAERDQLRNKTGYPDRASVEAFDRVLRVETPHIGYWLDSSDLTLAATVEQVISHLSEAVTQTSSTQEK